VAGDAAPTKLGISVGGRLDRLTIEISAQKFGARAYIRTRFRYSTNGSFWAGFTYDTYCEAADSASDITCCVAGQIEQSASGPSGPAGTGQQATFTDASLVFVRAYLQKAVSQLRHFKAYSPILSPFFALRRMQHTLAKPFGVE
jgi:hypothetical protein